MSDNLRDRIAAVQKAHVFCLVECSCGYQIDSIHPSSPDWKTDAECDWADHVADAVIEALKLHVVTVGDFQTVIKGSYPKLLEES